MAINSEWNPKNWSMAARVIGIVPAMGIFTYLLTELFKEFNITRLLRSRLKLALICLCCYLSLAFSIYEANIFLKPFLVVEALLAYLTLAMLLMSFKVLQAKIPVSLRK